MNISPRVTRTAARLSVALVVCIVPLLPRAADATVFLNGDFLQLPIDNSSQPGRFMDDNEASGAKYNVLGTGGASGQDFWVGGTPVYEYTIAINGSAFRSNGVGWAVAPAINDTSSGSFNSATITGQPFAGLTFTRLVTFADGSAFITITDTLTNGTGSPVTQMATLDSTDPDQDAATTFQTSNDVVSAQVGNDLAVAAGRDTGLSLGFGSPSPLRVVDFSGFANTDPYPIIASPIDPNGFAQDIGLNIAFDYGTLADGASKSVTWYMVFAPDKPAAISTYAVATGCGDGSLGAGEECDDGGTTAGNGCDSACRIEPCYSCSGAPSVCTPLPDGTACDDSLFCNGTDTCAAAACAIHAGDPCSGGPDCSDCNEGTNTCTAVTGTPCTDDGNTCTDDRCDGSGTCTHPDYFFVPCDDGLFCNGLDYCFDGSCAAHDGDPCIFDPCATGCNEAAGTCDPSLAGTACADDGNVCTDDQCDGAGACEHPPAPGPIPCSEDGNECTDDQCSGGSCGHPPLAGGTPCSSDGNDCTDDRCDGATACAHLPLADGAACNDVNGCTQTDQCQDGSCVGSNPIVCTTPLCHAPVICDPSIGACSSCPAGYSTGEGGCQRRYGINAAFLDNLAFSCGGAGAHRYNGCSSTSFGFHWTDAGDADVGAVTRVDVELNTGVDCSVDGHEVSLNGAPLGVYADTAGTACTCDPFPVPRLLSTVDTADYDKGGVNAVSITTSDCAGLSRDADGYYAVVTVTYADPGATVAPQSGCRQAAQSSFRYRGNADDAKDRMRWKWRKGDATTQAELGDPTASTDYQLCVFAESSGGPSLLIGADVPASATRWSAVGSAGYKYTDLSAGADGMKGILLRGGADGQAKLLVKGAGTPLGDPALPLSLAISGVRVQLTNQSSGVCWESEFPLSTITADDRNIKAAVR